MGHDVPRALHGMRSVMTCGVSCAACVIPTWSVTVSCHATQAITYEPVRCQPKVHSDSDLLCGKIHSELASKGWYVDWAGLREIVALCLGLHAPICKHLWSSGYDVSLTR